MSIIVAPCPAINPTFNSFGRRAPRGGVSVAGKRYRGGSFCPAFDESNPHELPVIDIRGDSYLIESVDPGSSYSAIRLTKLVSGSVYTVARYHAGHVTCECRGYDHRGECRHTIHAMAHGLLPIAPPPSPVVVAEVAPAVACDGDEPCQAEDDGQSWDDFDDEARWELGPDADPIDESDSAEFAGDRRLFAEAGQVRDEFRPSWVFGFTPSFDESAEWEGFAAGRASSASLAGPSHWTADRRGAFDLGLWSGRGARWAAEDAELAEWVAEHEALMESAFGDPDDRIHDSERSGVC